MIMKSKVTGQQIDSSVSDVTIFEGRITNLFEPWLVTGIPDSSWQTLQEKLCRLIKEIISAKEPRR